VDEPLGAQFLDVIDLQGQRLFARPGDTQVFGAEADGEFGGQGGQTASKGVGKMDRPTPGDNGNNVVTNRKKDKIRLFRQPKIACRADAPL
jgi:hypothetical protein